MVIDDQCFVLKLMLNLIINFMVNEKMFSSHLNEDLIVVIIDDKFLM